MLDPKNYKNVRMFEFESETRVTWHECFTHKVSHILNVALWRNKQNGYPLLSNYFLRIEDVNLEINR